MFYSTTFTHILPRPLSSSHWPKDVSCGTLSQGGNWVKKTEVREKCVCTAGQNHTVTFGHQERAVYFFYLHSWAAEKKKKKRSNGSNSDKPKPICGLGENALWMKSHLFASAHLCTGMFSKCPTTWSVAPDIFYSEAFFFVYLFFYQR